MNFTDFNLDNRIQEGISSLGFEKATAIQEHAIPVILEGKDLIASAQTGTGKTAAFLLPIIHKILTYTHDDCIKAMVIVPTRELAVQIDQHLDGLSYFTSVSSIAVYGGGDGIVFERTKKALTDGVDIIICTPGTMISHLNMGYMNLSGLKYLILDEADRMLDMGFYDDIIKIISFLPVKRQNLLFSATMPDKIRMLARKILVNPLEINLAVSKPPDKILQIAYVVYEKQKIPLILDLLKEKSLKSILIFCSTKSNTKQLSRELKRAGLNAEDMHSDLDQPTREKVLSQFKSKRLTILVATDILSRGIDVEDIDLVINFDVPNDGEDYIHRIGRTARAETDGVAITFINEKEQRQFLAIENLLEKTVHKAIVPEQYGETPVYEPEKHRAEKRKGKFINKKRNFKRSENKRRSNDNHREK